MSSEQAVESMGKALRLLHTLFKLKMVSRESFISFCETYNKAIESWLLTNLKHSILGVHRR